jgi:hypothetical protein
MEEWASGDPQGAERRVADLRGIILRLAAYRATHDGSDPPPNSALARERECLVPPRRPAPWRRLLRPLVRPFARPFARRPARPAATSRRPLGAYVVQRAFLTDDFGELEVARRLEAWPMISAYRAEGRVDTGEWFVFTVLVRASSAREARFLVDCIFASGPPETAAGSPGPDFIPPGA